MYVTSLYFFFLVIHSLTKMASSGSARLRIRRLRDSTGRWNFRLRSAEELAPVELVGGEAVEREERQVSR